MTRNTAPAPPVLGWSPPGTGSPTRDLPPAACSLLPPAPTDRPALHWLLPWPGRSPSGSRPGGPSYVGKPDREEGNGATARSAGGPVPWACLFITSGRHEGPVTPKNQSLRSRQLHIVTFQPGPHRVARMKRSVLTTARLMAEMPDQVSGRPDRMAMLTMTYADDQEWQPDDVVRTIRLARSFSRERDFSLVYLWVLEMTKRGRPHYHMALKLPATLKLPKPDDAGWWTKGMTRIEYARHPVAYMAKYLSKVDARDYYPKGHGCTDAVACRRTPSGSGGSGRGPVMPASVSVRGRTCSERLAVVGWIGKLALCYPPGTDSLAGHVIRCSWWTCGRDGTGRQAGRSRSGLLDR